MKEFFHKGVFVGANLFLIAFTALLILAVKQPNINQVFGIVLIMWINQNVGYLCFLATASWAKNRHPKIAVVIILYAVMMSLQAIGYLMLGNLSLR
jgi:hypothetical protein